MPSLPTLAALLLGIVMFLTLLSRSFRGCRFYIRILSAYLLLASVASYGVLASLFLRLIGKVSIAQWATARAFDTIGCPAMGIDFSLSGEEHLRTRPAVFISNHQSELDILFLGRAFPKHCSVTAKRSLKYTPFLGWFMALSGTVFIDRTNRRSAISAFDSAVATIRGKRQSVWIFPEGTRSYLAVPDLLPFKKGAFHLAVQAGVPIVPVVVQNYGHVLHIQKRRFEGGTIRAKVLEPIPTVGLGEKDVEALAVRVREVMLKELMDMGVGTVKEE